MLLLITEIKIILVFENKKNNLQFDYQVFYFKTVIP